nr:translation initiation factor IF-2-like isoform X3 [Pongo pygmaeus]
MLPPPASASQHQTLMPWPVPPAGLGAAGPEAETGHSPEPPEGQRCGVCSAQPAGTLCGHLVGASGSLEIGPGPSTNTSAPSSIWLGPGQPTGPEAPDTDDPAGWRPGTDREAGAGLGAGPAEPHHTPGGPGGPHPQPRGAVTQLNQSQADTDPDPCDRDSQQRHRGDLGEQSSWNGRRKSPHVEHVDTRRGAGAGL